jgi:hypothetical protein
VIRRLMCFSGLHEHRISKTFPYIQGSLWSSVPLYECSHCGQLDYEGFYRTFQRAITNGWMCSENHCVRPDHEARFHCVVDFTQYYDKVQGLKKEGGNGKR